MIKVVREFVLSLYVEIRICDNFRQDRVARFSRSVARDAVGEGQILFEHVLQCVSRFPPFLNVAPHFFLRLRRA